MPDIMDLIAEILDNPKLKNVASKIQSEYHDEPILRTVPADENRQTCGRSSG